MNYKDCVLCSKKCHINREKNIGLEYLTEEARDIWQILNGNNNLPFPGIEKVYKAICKILSNNNHAIGFLVSLPINLGDRYLYGLLTTNQNLSENNLKIGNKLDLHLINSNQKISFIIQKSSFVFLSFYRYNICGNSNWNI